MRDLRDSRNGRNPLLFRSATHVLRAKTQFAADSPLEGTGFEPSVPRRDRNRTHIELASSAPPLDSALHGQRLLICEAVRLQRFDARLI
jgi:hypothetical protein